MMCTSADVNMAKVPRSQSVVHFFEDKVSFSIHSSHSSVPEVSETGVNWGFDRAAIVDPMNQEDIAKTLSTLNFMSVRMNGGPFFVFERDKDCSIKYRKNENAHEFIGKIECETDLPMSKPVTFTPEKEFHDGEIALKRVKASVVSTDETAFGGTDDEGKRIGLRQINYTYRYDFTFSTSEGEKNMSYMLRYKNLLDRGPNECLQRDLDPNHVEAMKKREVTEVKIVENPVVLAEKKETIRSCQRVKVIKRRLQNQMIN